MIFEEIDEVTSRDMYFFFRGELKEYMRNHPDLNDSERRQLTAWVKTGLGQSIHSSPLLVGVRSPHESRLLPGAEERETA